jgi:hypothetical protein
MIQDKAIESTAGVRLKPITIPIVTALSLSGVTVASIKPGFSGIVERIEDFARTVTSSITYNAYKGSTTLLTGNATPVAATRTDRALTTTLADTKFTSSDVLNIKITTDGTGAATNLLVTVWVRPFPMNGEV